MWERRKSDRPSTAQGEWRDALIGSSPETDRALAALRVRIDRRIRPHVSHLSEGEIADLIDWMARIKLKYEGAGALRMDDGVQ